MFFKRCLFLLVLVFVVLPWAMAEDAVFAGIDKIALFEDLVKQVERLDAEILDVRQNRPVTWKDTLQVLKTELVAAKTDAEIYHVFKKLDATYPGLHTSMAVPQSLNLAQELSKKFQLPFRIFVEYDHTQAKFLIGPILPMVRAWVSERDELLAIEGVDIGELREDAFLFCDYPLQKQCDNDFQYNFESGFFDVTLKDKTHVKLKIRRDGIEHELSVPIVNAEAKKTLRTPTNVSSSEKCFEETKRYPNALPLYLGNSVCLYEIAEQKIAILRVMDFRGGINAKHQMVSFEDDVLALRSVWQKKFTTWKTLILDVIDNGGGTVPIVLTKLLMDQPFQDQWVRFKNLSEYQNPLFYSQVYNSTELYRELQKKTDKKKAFLSPMPQFPNQDEGAGVLYQPDEFAYRGKMILLTNQNCISSCSGFVWSLHRYAAKRLVSMGQPDSGDSTYDRFNILVFRRENKKGYEMVVWPYKIRPAVNGFETLLRWTVSVSQSTDQDGTVYSMQPDPVDNEIGNRRTHTEWIRTVIDQALFVSRKK